jgi:hypothetical protein
MKNTKKTFQGIVIVIVSLLVFLVGSAKAQIFLQDFEQTDNPRVEADDYGFIIGTQGSDADQYVPLGDGLLVLVGLGGAYLLKNRKRGN